MVLPTNTFVTNAAVYLSGLPIALRASATVTDPASCITQVGLLRRDQPQSQRLISWERRVAGANARSPCRYTAPPLGTNWARAVAWDSKGRSNVSPRHGLTS